MVRNPPVVGALAEAVRSRRRALDLNQGEVAALAGCGRLFVQALESGKPGLRLDKVLAVLGAVGLRFAVEEGIGGIVQRGQDATDVH